MRDKRDALSSHRLFTRILRRNSLKGLREAANLAITMAQEYSAVVTSPKTKTEADFSQLWAATNFVVTISLQKLSVYDLTTIPKLTHCPENDLTIC